MGEIAYGKPSVYGPRRQNLWQLIYVETGELDMTLAKVGECRVAAGQAVISLPGARETFRFAGGTRHGWVEARMPAAMEPERPARLRVVPFPAALWVVVEALRLCAGADGAVESKLGRELAGCLFRGCLEPTYVRGPLVRALHPAVAKAQRRMRNAYGEPLSLEELSREAGITPAHLIRLYRREIGRTPARELQRIRLCRAEEMLVNSGWTVAEIAHHCGFADPQHFSKCFRAGRGLPPGQYRRQRWNGDNPG